MNSKTGRTGNISYVKGAIEVKRPGYYFVYSQMYYTDGLSYNGDVGHTTYLNKRKIMKSWGTLRNTTYHGGVFHLKKGDTLKVKIPKMHVPIKLDKEATFFGAFLLQADQI